MTQINHQSFHHRKLVSINHLKSPVLIKSFNLLDDSSEIMLSHEDVELFSSSSESSIIFLEWVHVIMRQEVI